MRKQNLQNILLAAALALPLAAWAEEYGDEAPGAPAHGQRADDRRGPAPGPQGPHEGLREGEDFDGPRGPGRGPMRFGIDHVPPYLHGLDLTEAQQDKIFTLVHGQVPYLREQARAREKAGRALAEMHGAAKFDDAAAVRLAQAAVQAEANITLSHLRTEQKVLAVLTADQRKALDQRRAALHDDRGPRRAPANPAAPQ